MKTTQTNGNTRNKIRGSRIRFWDDNNKMVGELTVPHRDATYYCLIHPTGKYGIEYKRLMDLIDK